MHWAKSAVSRLYRGTYYYPVVCWTRLLLQVLERSFQEELREGIETLRKGQLASRTVLSGPFKGLRYPRDMSIDSPYLPKLLGTYEKEICLRIEPLLARRSYDMVIDVGCAEGFYAVGLAMRCPGARVHAFDINPNAEHCLHELADANGVAERVRFHPIADHASVGRIADQAKQGLFISDCEGYELDLLKAPLLEKLATWDLIVETHDSLEVKVTRTLIRRLRATHRVTVVHWKRRRLEDYPSPHKPTPIGCLGAMDERRTWRNKWLCCESLKYAKQEG